MNMYESSVFAYKVCITSNIRPIYCVNYLDHSMV